MPTLIMLALVSALIIAHELGHYWVARWCGIRVERFGFGLPFGPTLWSKKVGDTEFCVHLALFGGYVAFPDDNPDSDIPKDSSERFENKTVFQRFAVAIAGIVVNALLGWAIMLAVAMSWGIPDIERIDIVDTLGADSPAAVAGVQAGDTIISVDGKSLADYHRQDKLNVVTETIHAHANKELILTVRRKPVEEEGNEIEERQDVRTVSEDSAVTAEEVVLTVVPDEKGLIGVQLAPVGQHSTAYESPVEASQAALGFLGEFVVQNFQALGGLFTGKVAMDQLSGPIRIIEQGGKVIEQNGMHQGLILTAIISTILAVMNLLPIPALDGGHILFLVIEAIKGSPVKKSLQEASIQVGFLLLLLFMGFVVANDVVHLVSPAASGHSEEVTEEKPLSENVEESSREAVEPRKVKPDFSPEALPKECTATEC